MFNQLKANLQAIQTKASSLITAERKAQAKELGNKAVQYAKENPTDIMVGILSLIHI